ncbi:uncharacterized protein [Gossypium hirsutum]|uniref:Gag-Pol polyprotein n=1 Tax=Gossypium hirsutum TaxID=3635 RepID=A0A1U8M370_GOSHI|nr:uncharacterized protein LOC107933523 [Gossypium hirsutum]
MTSIEPIPNEVESNAQAFVHRVALSGTRPATSVASVGSIRDAKPECKHYNRPYYGECRVKSEVCFKCGFFDHYLRDFLEKSEKEKAQTTRPSNATARGRTPRNPRNVSGSCGVMKVSTVRSKKARVPTSTYAIRACEDTFAPNVITGTFFIYDIDVTALINSGSNHSYVCTNLISCKNLPIECTQFVVRVSNPLGQDVLLYKVCKNCPLMTQSYSFSANLMLLLFDGFDVILGMDWLTLYAIVVNCRQKLIVLKCKNGEMLRIESDNLSGLLIVILAMSSHKYVRNYCNAYLDYVLDTKVSESKLKLVPVVCEYPDVFPEELPRLLPVRKVEFPIELVPGTPPILITPYRMAPTELQ